MKFYYYIVFYLYSYYKKREPNNEEWYYLSLTSLAMTFILFFNVYSLFLLFVHYNLLPNIGNKQSRPKRLKK